MVINVFINKSMLHQSGLNDLFLTSNRCSTGELELVDVLSVVTVYCERHD